MKNRDELKGKAKQAKGRAKEAIADLTDNERLRQKGTDERVTGEVQEDMGRARRKVGEAVEKIGKQIKR